MAEEGSAARQRWRAVIAEVVADLALSIVALAIVAGLAMAILSVDVPRCSAICNGKGVSHDR